MILSNSRNSMGGNIFRGSRIHALSHVRGECLEYNAGKNIKRRAKRKRERDSFKHCC